MDSWVFITQLIFFVKNTRRRKSITYFLFLLFLISLSLYSFQLYILTSKYYNPPTSHFSNNYFLSAEDAANLDYIVDTPTCKILNISAWDHAILSILKEEEVKRKNCHLKPRQWTYNIGANLVINESSMIESGYSLRSVSCCYMTISRVEQSINNYDKNADRIIKFSNCKPLKLIVNPMIDPYVRVHCIGKYWPFSSDVLYRQFHAFPLPPPSSKHKFNYWSKTPKDVKRPPNILIIGIDSMSRLSFTRTMPKTKDVLSELGAVEMFGYTKVGENTLPNIHALMSGYYENELREFCFFGNDKAEDDCPFLWKRYSEANYLTGIIEDAPLLAVFHYLKTGFVQKPTDIYFRPFMLGVHDHEPSPFFTIDCIGKDTVDELILRYLSDLMKMSQNKDVPFFLFSWLTNLAHGSLVGGKNGDEIYSNWLKKLDLNNTVLLFMSDHGYRFGSIRATFPGWYEDKLPNFWIYLPNSIKQKHKEWIKNLQINSQRLSSPFDVYRTLSGILDEYTPNIQELPIGITPNGKRIERKYGQSLFNEIPLLRRCSDCGISNSYCGCVVPTRLPVNDSHLEGAALAATAHINSFLPPPCAKLSSSVLNAGAIINYWRSEDGGFNSTYIVAFNTIPGDFIFEANVNFYSQNSRDPGLFTLNSDILRMNKINSDVSCVRDPLIEKFCYCNNNNKLHSTQNH